MIKESATCALKTIDPFAPRRSRDCSLGRNLDGVLHTIQVARRYPALSKAHAWCLARSPFVRQRGTHPHFSALRIGVLFGVAAPASCSRKIAMICSSPNLLRLVWSVSLP